MKDLAAFWVCHDVQIASGAEDTDEDSESALTNGAISSQDKYNTVASNKRMDGPSGSG